MTHFEAFDAAYARLAAVYGQTPEPGGVTLHYEAVKGIPMESFAPVATRLAKSCKWFPRPAEWLDAYEAEQDARRRAIDRKLDDRPDTFHCLTCRDSGWEEGRCEPGRYCSTCQRWPSKHLYDHNYVMRCACWKTNPTLEARRQAQRTTVQTPKRAA